MRYQAALYPAVLDLSPRPKGAEILRTRPLNVNLRGSFHTIAPNAPSIGKIRPVKEKWVPKHPFFYGKLARPERFELPTTKFVAWYSIQLSYGRVEPIILHRQCARAAALRGARLFGSRGAASTLL